MTFHSRNIVMTALSFCAVGAVIIACGSSGDSKFDDGKNPANVFGDGGNFGDGGVNPDDELYKNDPPPAFCGPDAGGNGPVPIGGTEECPDDKNKPGCGCATPGETAPCWTGLRKNRYLGACKDGVATCKKQNETANVWGACEGQVLPQQQATGELACSCFSIGLWKIANTTPCNWTNDGTNYYAYSTQYVENPSPPAPAGSYRQGYCGGAIPGGGTDPHLDAPGKTTPGIWSPNTLTADCAGKFKLCFRVRAGDYNAPNGNDCILGESCIDADYQVPKVEQKMPDLQPWAGTDAACSKKWEKDTPENVSPGYGEMIVRGKTVQCQEIDDGKGSDANGSRIAVDASGIRSSPARASSSSSRRQSAWPGRGSRGPAPS